MEEQDYTELLRHTQEQLREVGMTDLADRLTGAIDLEPSSPPDRMLLLLDALEVELRLQDAGTARTIATQFANVARTRDGGPPEGIWLDLSPAHQELFGQSGLDLAAGPDLQRPIADLRRLRTQLRIDLGIDFLPRDPFP